MTARDSDIDRDRDSDSDRDRNRDRNSWGRGRGRSRGSIHESYLRAVLRKDLLQLCTVTHL